MNRWGPTKRTRADKERDCQMFCATARIEAVRAISDADLAARYGCDPKKAAYLRHMRLQRENAA